MSSEYPRRDARLNEGFLDGIDPFFILDYRPLDEPDPLEQGDRRASTYWDVQRGCRGPAPVPGWLVTDAAAVDTDLGVVKTGKEADVHLVERAVPGGKSCLMAVKFYRGSDHRTFHRSATYTEGRRTRRSRDTRALARRSSYGRELEAHAWASAEWVALCRYWSAGFPVPYPVQVDRTEVCMEFIGDEDGTPAPRLAQLRPEPESAARLFEQARQVVLDFAADGVARADLSPYNLLVAGERLVVIDSAAGGRRGGQSGWAGAVAAGLRQRVQLVRRAGCAGGPGGVAGAGLGRADRVLNRTD